MKQFSVSCTERSLVIEYPRDTNKNANITLAFANIKEKHTFSDISWLSVILTIILDAFLLLSTVRHGFDNPIFLGCLAFAFIGSLKFVNAIEKIIRINFTKEGRQASRLHSAIHQTINAMIKEDTLKLDVSQIKKASRFSSSCETLYTTESILLGFLSIPIVVFTYHKLWLCLILLLILRVMVENMLDSGAFNFLQIFFLRKPTDREIKLVYHMLCQCQVLDKT